MKEKGTFMFPYDMTGRRVDFTNKPPLAWGIELDLPFDSGLRQLLRQRYDLRIPGRVTKLKFLEMSPQESLYKKQRNISSKHKDKIQTALEALAEVNASKTWAETKRIILANIFFSVFAKNSEQISQFNKLVASSGGDTILVAEGHGYSAPLHLGEQTAFDPLGHERQFQKPGNSVPAKDILKKYNRPDIYSGIVLVACYNGLLKVKALDIPLAYGIGEISTDEARKGNIQTVVVPPRKLPIALQKTQE